MAETLTSTTARKYRKEYGPDKPTLALARILYKENKKLYTSVDHARTALRAIEGKLGKSSKGLIDKSLVRDDARPYNPYKLPESDEHDYTPYVLTGYKKAGVINDVHVPYHSVAALSVAIKYLKKEAIDVLIINGDFWDFYKLSRFIKDPGKKNLSDELDMGVAVLTILQKELGCKLIYKPGNHCDRLFLYMQQKVGEIPELVDLEEIKEINLESIVRKRAPHLDIEFVASKQIIKANDLCIVHGHEFASSIMSPVNIARGLYLKAKASTICGHHHRTSEHTEGDINERIVTTWSVGALCELHPEYMPINNWNHGFAVVELAENGKDFHVQNKRIYKGKVL